jgi:hypothetical protein
MIWSTAQRDLDGGINLELGWERWLLFDGTAAAFAFASFGGASGGDFAGLHEFTNVSAPG